MDSDLSFSSSNSSLGLKHVTINIDQDQEYRKDERDQAKSFKQAWCVSSELDSFFTRIYEYHRRQGFACMFLEDLLQLILIWFVVSFCTLLSVGIDYQLLYQDKGNLTKVELTDIILPWNVVKENFSSKVVLSLMVAGLYLAYRSMKTISNVSKYWKMSLFYGKELGIKLSELRDMTWIEIQNKIMKIQKNNELDICHRILRIKNYMITMVNKDILPIKFHFPVLGESVFFTYGLKLNYEMIFFTGPGALFKNVERVKSKCREPVGRSEVHAELSNRILLFAIVNFVIMPFTFMWTLLHICFENFALFRSDPSLMGSRTWSVYGRHYFRHYNELDHDFEARLNKGYKTGVKYMGLYTSPMLASLAKFVIACSGFILLILVTSTLIDEDTLQLKGIIGAITMLGIVATVARSFIPDENMVVMPETLMSYVLYYIHYIPEHWVGRAHTQLVRSEFGQLFQHKIVVLLAEVLSPIFTPFILWLWLKPRSAKIIEFFRSNSPRLNNLGNVCMPAHLDFGMVAAHQRNRPEECEEKIKEMKKMELSLLHFSQANPEWRTNECQGTILSILKKKSTKLDIKTSLDLMTQDGPLHNSSAFFKQPFQYHSLTMSEFDVTENNKGQNGAGNPGHVDSNSSQPIHKEAQMEQNVRSIGCHAIRLHVNSPTGSVYHSGQENPELYPSHEETQTILNIQGNGGQL